MFIGVGGAHMVEKNLVLRVLFSISCLLFLLTAFIAYEELKIDKLNFFTKIIYWEFFAAVLFFYLLKDMNFKEIIKVNSLMLVLFLLESVLISERYAEFLLRFLFIAFLAGGVKWYVDQRYKKTS